MKPRKRRAKPRLLNTNNSHYIFRLPRQPFDSAQGDGDRFRLGWLSILAFRPSLSGTAQDDRLFT
jgi:hypothetical protein